MNAYGVASEARTLAWLMMGSTGSTPGMLMTARGRLRFDAFGRGALTGGQVRELEKRTGRPTLGAELDAGRAVTLFDAPLDVVGDVRFPWYHFGGGMKISVAGAPYRFSFLRPQNTRMPDDVRGVADIPSGRASGKTWKAALRRPA
ncbi:hypothetical protein [Spirillospora albida]|uniref:hypothetical protein n=1 Tax=Spirillospora albida TaxID=58123 RepID=UPI0012FACE3E|nr:hypothetical protein [Spirillospora albida]